LFKRCVLLFDPGALFHFFADPLVQSNQLVPSQFLFMTFPSKDLWSHCSTPLPMIPSFPGYVSSLCRFRLHFEVPPRFYLWRFLHPLPKFSPKALFFHIFFPFPVHVAIFYQDSRLHFHVDPPFFFWLRHNFFLVASFPLLFSANRPSNK